MSQPNKQTFYGLFDVALDGYRVGMASTDYAELEQLGATFIADLVVNEGYPEDVATLSPREILDYYDLQIHPITEEQFHRIIEASTGRRTLNI